MKQKLARIFVNLAQLSLTFLFFSFVVPSRLVVDLDDYKEVNIAGASLLLAIGILFFAYMFGWIPPQVLIVSGFIIRVLTTFLSIEIALKITYWIIYSIILMVIFTPVLISGIRWKRW